VKFLAWGQRVPFQVYQEFLNKERKIGVVGLGYVGLPLAELLGRKFKVLGFDVNIRRVEELTQGVDSTRELTPQQLSTCGVEFTSDPQSLCNCSLVIVAVPTPIDKFNRPDLGPLLRATRSVGENITSGAVVVYESTVYPGVTEDECVPILEEASGLVWKRDFFVGYSPERVNPGDKNHTIEKIVKVVAGDTPATLELLQEVYGAVVSAGIHAAPTIKTAEAAKVIENTQRDLNIALMNELAIIFNLMGINTNDVLAAARSKWNFINFYPGLVGGHCIGVDPYYLTFKAEGLGYHPQVILSGRRINDRMGKYVAEQTIKRLVQSGKVLRGGRVLICGFTFKENIPDIRNTRVIDIHNELKEFGLEPVVYDPMVDQGELQRQYGIQAVSDLDSKAPYLGVILAVGHKIFSSQLTIPRLCEIQEGQPVVMDLKGIIPREDRRREDLIYMSL